MEIEWLSKKGYGVHGVYNPKTKQVEWRAFRNGGVYGVWYVLLGESNVAVIELNV